MNTHKKRYRFHSRWNKEAMLMRVHIGITAYFKISNRASAPIKKRSLNKNAHGR